MHLEPETLPTRVVFTPHKSGPRDLSVIIPAKDEGESLEELYGALTRTLERMGRSYEIIFVNDGSTDNTQQVIERLHERDARVVGIEFRKNFGQTPALAAGIDHATGAIIIVLDADLQNDPYDIPLLVAKIDEGYDIVSGWRKDRKDTMVTRRIPSLIANYLLNSASKTPVHDLGCALKAYRREVLEGVRLYGDMHRYLPIYAGMNGARIAEIVVNHRPRIFGKSKYGLSRIFKVIIDMVTIQFWANFLTKPMRFFGMLGLTLGAAGILAGIYLTYIKIAHGAAIGDRPLLIFAVLSMLAGLQIVGLGILGEMLSRSYFEAQGRKTYSIRKIVA
ncbi:MAG: glycosyl transferase [Candidatus Yonathbacteria bacterium RIFOXYC1_FULL_52_10]|uniref:Glycosyl transferase n=1 Tax=Candidatus Yonathbacteria bacterium RIFOXYD1_FULL_52_36 TaxID=1802730 RepID=A0A1G2SJ16_9BACT|nr:MAG: glycosyl transferase [Candidatus Yonathbacteria bacterium RIFOXYC1_FULL_52_10]OHA84742.1 MAG: glycosyl transferase [Candidatus Yonathbacteria bacterium RIFOXYD1_FULL_52_36]